MKNHTKYSIDVVIVCKLRILRKINGHSLFMKISRQFLVVNRNYGIKIQEDKNKINNKCY